MSDQIRIPGLEPSVQIIPAPDRAAPTIWVKRLLILRELKPGAAHIIRNVELRRGLNVVWAPPGETGENQGLFTSGVAGHTAGKTTFCRLLRYALGERTFASESTRARIRERLPSAWLVAEVMIEMRSWIVARPFAVGPHPFSIPDASVEAATEGGDRVDYQVFLDAVGAAMPDRLPATQFPTRDEHIRWEHILPWVARDQEARFADLLEWRHSTSQSETPALTIEERQFLIRSVLGAITDLEREEQQRNVRLVAAKKQAAHRQPLLAHQARVDHARVERLLGISMPSPSTEFFGSAARGELQRRWADFDERVESHRASDRRDALRWELERRVADEANARRDLEQIEGHLADQQAILAQLSGVALFSSLPPAREYCGVPLLVAREHQCPLVSNPTVDLGLRRGEHAAEAELDRLREHARALKLNQQENQAKLDAATAAVTTARSDYVRAESAFAEQRSTFLEERERLREIDRLIEHAEAAWVESNDLAFSIQGLEVEIEQSYARQEELRHRASEPLAHFSSTFEYVVRALLGDEVEARVETSGRSLKLVAEHHGERESAALATVKLLAFDLAALTASILGRGHHPRLLVHDGPREADMAPGVYGRLFLYAQLLEECFTGEAGFQYIVTTTTPPPEPIMQEPWLRLTLGGVPTENRLLRMDL
jgi:hypothetical protein